MRRSASLHAAALVFIVCATIAVQVTFGARIGMVRALPLTCAVVGLLGVGALRWRRGQLSSLEIGPDVLTARNVSGEVTVSGRIIGCSQWAGRLLMLSVARDEGSNKPRANRRAQLLIPVDAIPASAFRKLAVLGRRGSHA